VLGGRPAPPEQPPARTPRGGEELPATDGSASERGGRCASLYDPLVPLPKMACQIVQRAAWLLAHWHAVSCASAPLNARPKTFALRRARSGPSPCPQAVARSHYIPTTRVSENVTPQTQSIAPPACRQTPASTRSDRCPVGPGVGAHDSIGRLLRAAWAHSSHMAHDVRSADRGIGAVG